MKKIISLLFVAGVLNTVAASQTPEVSVYMDSLLQHVTGFGGTFNEIGWNALQSLSGRT
jgi:glucosylceramidase